MILSLKAFFLKETIIWWGISSGNTIMFRLKLKRCLGRQKTMTSDAMKFVLLWYKIISMPPTSSREVFHGFPFQICPKDSGRVRRVFYKENVKCYVMPLENVVPLLCRFEVNKNILWENIRAWTMRVLVPGPIIYDLPTAFLCTPLSFYGLFKLCQSFGRVFF